MPVMVSRRKDIDLFGPVPIQKEEVEMNSFFVWLTKMGFKHTSGDYHWNNSGWWFPELPKDLSADNATLPGWFIWISKDRESDTVFIDQQSKSGREGLIATDDPERAKKVVDGAIYKYLMESDEALEGGLGGFSAAQFPKACPCGKKYTKAQWEKLPSKGIQVIEADEEGPEERLDLRNCSCGSTLATQLETE